MKPHFLFLMSLLLLFGAVLNAQNKPGDEILNQPMIGVTGGITLNSISGDAPKNFNYTRATRFTFGLNGEIPVGNGIKVCLQPRYLQSGAGLQFDAGREVYIDSMQADLNYISVPVFIKILAFNDVTYFTSGVDVCFLLDAELKNIVDKSAPEKDIAYAINKFDMQVFFGFGVRFRIGLPELNIEARYSKGFINASSGNNDLSRTLPARFTLGGFQLLANINFPLTKSGRGK